MYRRILAKMTATATVIALAMTPGVTSFATELDGDQVQTITADSENVTVNGSVDVNEGIAVNAYAYDVEITGDVTGMVFATGGEINIGGDVNSNGDVNCLLNEDLGYVKGGLVDANGEGTSVNVSGNVNGANPCMTKEEDINLTSVHYSTPTEFKSVTEFDTRTTTGGASSGVYVTDGASVTVGGSVSGGTNGAKVYGESNLTVNEDVISNGSEIVLSGMDYSKKNGAEFDEENWKLSKKGKGEKAADCTQSSTGIYTDGDSTILVKGDVTGNKEGIRIAQTRFSSTGSGSITVLGTIKGEKYGIELVDAMNMYSYIPEGKENETAEEFNQRLETAANDYIKEIPDFTVYAIEGNKAINDGILSVNKDGKPITVESYPAYKIVYDHVVNAIDYIIKHDDESLADCDLTINAGTKDIDATNYYVAKINQAFNVAANLPSGYTLSAGNNVKVTENGDGTYSLILTDVRGGINIKAKLKPVDLGMAASEDYEVIIQEVETAQAVFTPAEQQVINTIAVSNTSNDATFVAAISGEKPAQTVSFEVSKVSPEQYKEAVINSITSVPANGALNLVTDKPSVIDAKIAEAIAARNDIDVNVVFNYGGKRYKVVIPAGYDVKSLLDANGYCGFLKLLAVLGGTAI